MKLIATATLLTLAATFGHAQGFAGHVSASYGFGGLTENPNNTGLDSIEGDSYTGLNVQGSVGFSLGGNIGIQVDGGYNTTAPTGDDYYDATAYNLHVFFPVGNMQLGAFYGFGTGDHIYDSDEGNVTYYGVEAAMPMGSGQLAAQLGLATHVNSHDSLDYENAFFGSVQYTHFVNDRLALRGTAGLGNFVTHGDPGTLYLLQADAIYALSGNLAATVGVRDMILVNEGEGSGNDFSVYVGLQLGFGASGLRETMAATPMIATMLPSLAAVASSIVD